MNKLNFNRGKKCTFIFIIAAIIFFALMGKSLPFTPTITATDVSIDRVGHTGRSIIDDSHLRVILCDDADRVTGIVKNGVLASEPELYFDVMSGNGAFYVSECTGVGNCIRKEQIVKYSPSGEREGVVLSREYEVPDDGVMQPRYYPVSIEDDRGLALFNSLDLKKATLVSFPLDPIDNPGPGEVIAEYPDSCGGGIIYANNINTKDGTLYTITEDGYLWRLRPGASAEKLTDTPETKDFIDIDPSDGSIIYTCDSEGVSFTCSVWLIVKSVLFYLAAAFLVIAAIVAAIKGIIRITRENNPESIQKLKNIFIVIGIIIGAAAIVVVYSRNMAEVGVKNENETINITTSTMCTTYGDRLRRVLKLYREGDESEFNASVEGIEETFETIAADSTDQNHSVVPLLLALDDSGDLVVLASPDAILQRYSKYPYFIESIDDLEKNDGLYSITDGSLWGEYLCTLAPVRDDDGTVLGVLELYTNYSGLQGVQIKNIFTIFLVLLSAAIMVAFIINEGRNWAKSFVDYRRYKREGMANPAVALVRPLFFLIVATISADSSICALVAKDMLTTAGMGDNNILLSLPMLGCSLGILLGYGVFNMLEPRFGQKKTTMGSLVLAIAMYLMAVFAVSRNNFVLYIIAIFFASCSGMVIEGGIFRLILSAEDKRVRAAANRATATATISASALIGLAAGYAATLLGNASVYIVSVIPLVLYGILYICFVLKIPLDVKDKKSGSGDVSKKAGRKNAGNLKSCFAFLITPRMILLLVCVMLPLAVSTGFKSYLFPLFASGQGIDKSMISVMVVISNTVIYFAAPAFAKAEEAYGYKKLAFYCILAIAMALVIFIFNGSLLWAFTAMIIIGMANKVGGPCWQMIWPEEARDFDLNENLTDMVVRGSYGIWDALKGPILGSLLNFGNTAACVIFGAFSAVAAAVYKLGSRKKQIKS